MNIFCSKSSSSLDLPSSRSRLEKQRKSDPKLTTIVEKTFRKRFANAPREENSIFSLTNATWRRFWSPRRAVGRSRALFLVSRCVLGSLLGGPGACRGRPGTRARRSRDAFGTLLGASGRPERVPGSILVQFRVPRETMQMDFGVHFCVTFASELASEWHAS